MSYCSEKVVPNKVQNIIFVVAIQLCKAWGINKPTCSLGQAREVSLNSKQSTV
jgi:hypothetical protein